MIPRSPGESAGGTYTSSYYLDLNSDCIPELAALREEGGDGGGQKWLDVWSRKEGSQYIAQEPPISLPFNTNVILSHLNFIDMGKPILTPPPNINNIEPPQLD